MDPVRAQRKGFFLSVFRDISALLSALSAGRSLTTSTWMRSQAAKDATPEGQLLAVLRRFQAGALSRDSKLAHELIQIPRLVC